MTRVILAALLSTALAGQASALSCLRPSVQATFAQANASASKYVLAVGRVSLAPGTTLPSTGDDPNARTGYSVDARFDGDLASATGFDEKATFPLTVEVTCTGPWCGGVPQQAERMLLFVERRDDANVLVEGPCPFFALAATPEALAAALSCVKGGTCEVE